MTADTVGGVWNYALELVGALAPHGVEVVLATQGEAPSPAQRREAERLPNLTLTSGLFKLEWMRSPWQEVAQAGEWLLELERQWRPDLIHLNGYVHGALPWRSPVLVVGHSCVLSWWRAVRGEEAPSDWDRYRREVRRGIEAADCVVAPTVAMLDSLRHDYGPFRHGKVIPNGRNPALFAPSKKVPFILTAGRLWDEAKNIGQLDRIASTLPWPVCVAGESFHPDRWEVRFDALQPLGRLDPPALARWLSEASIFALPARYEPFGLLPLEAALSGCALVLGDLPSLREVWGDAALFVPPDNAEALRETLLRLIGDPPFSESMGRRAQRRARRYTPERMAAEYSALYGEMLARHGASREGNKAALTPHASSK
ncbi:MAG: glycosyltransferase family 4 protein [Nitrospirae bacterium]|nr:glycosyltransferase family 4 protein [Candidatus Manganitrophaceae bacterium]